MGKSAHKRHIAKTVSWRIVGTVDTILLSWILTGDAFIGLQIGMAEVATKMILYYFHERFWDQFALDNPERMHLVKTITWRFVGTMDTMMLAWIITGDPLTGMQIGVVEVITKMALYYLHERLWHRVDYGLRDA